MQFTSLQLLGMARGVASGMKYLNELGFIHRVSFLLTHFYLTIAVNKVVLLIWFLVVPQSNSYLFPVSTRSHNFNQILT